MAIRVSSLLAAIAFFLLFAIASRFTYKNRFKVDYSVKNMFPFEFNYNAAFHVNLYGNCGIVLSIFASIFFFVFLDTSYHSGYLIACMISGIISAIMVLCLSFLQPKLYKWHFIFAALLFTSLFMTAALLAIEAFSYWHNANMAIGGVTFFVSTLLAIFIFAIAMNPRLTKPVKSEVKVIDGVEMNVRPKYVALAFSEWILFFVFYLEMILLFVFSFAL